MNTVLLNFDSSMTHLMHKIGDPSDPSKYRVNINFTGFNDIKNIIGFYRNGVFTQNKYFYFRNGIFEMENMLMDEKDKIFFVCLVNDITKKRYLMAYPIINYYVLDDNVIKLESDNIDVNRKYTIEGLIVNGVLYAKDEIEVISDSKIKFKAGFDIIRRVDELKLLILADSEK